MAHASLSFGMCLLRVVRRMVHPATGAACERVKSTTLFLRPRGGRRAAKAGGHRADPPHIVFDNKRLDLSRIPNSPETRGWARARFRLNSS